MTAAEPTQILYPPSRRRIAGVSDLLVWLVAPRPGVIICKDGSFLAGYYYVGRDLTTLANHDRNRISMTMASAVQALKGDWSVHIDATRLPANPYPERRDWPDRVSGLIDDERRAQYETIDTSYESIRTIVLRWRPPSPTKRRMSNLLFNRASTSVDLDLEQCLGEFDEALHAFEDALANSLSLVRMGLRQEANGRYTDELWSHLRWTLTEETLALAPRLPVHTLDQQTACEYLFCGETLRFGNEWIHIVGIDDLPDSTSPDLMHELQALPFPARWNTRFVPLDESSARRELKAIRVKWAQQTRGLLDRLAHPQPTTSSVIDQDALAMQGEAEAQLSTLSSGRLGFGHLTSVIVLRHTDLEVLRERSRTVRQLLQHYGFSARIETINSVEGFLGSLPGHVVENVRSQLIDTLTLANLLPLSSTWTGPSHCPSPLIEKGEAPPLVVCRTEGSTPFQFSLHVQDVGHTLLFGATGAGKSTLIALLCAQWLRYEDARVVIIDKDRSLETLTRAVGGAHHELTLDRNTQRFAPFHAIDDPVERAWASEWIEAVCRVQGIAPTLAQRELIHDALSATGGGGGSRTFSAVTVAIQDTEIKTALEPYGAGGMYGELFNGERDDITLERWLCIELADVMSANEKLRLPALSYLFHIVERQATGQPLLLVVDEAWAALQHDAFRESLREWLKTFRKQNVAVLLATQSLSDVTRSGILDVLAESCPTRIYGANAEAHQHAETYAALGLQAPDLELIANLQPKRDYYVVQRGEGARVVDFHLGPETLAFCGVASKDDLKRVAALRDECPDDWTERWLQERIDEN